MIFRYIRPQNVLVKRLNLMNFTKHFGFFSPLEIGIFAIKSCKYILNQLAIIICSKFVPKLFS